MYFRCRSPYLMDSLKISKSVIAALIPTYPYTVNVNSSKLIESNNIFFYKLNEIVTLCNNFYREPVIVVF